MGLASCSKAIQTFLERFFGSLGAIVGKFPKITILVSSIISLAFFGGFFVNWTPENRVNKLWIPQSAQAIKDEEWVSSVFGYESRTFEIYIKPKDDDNVLKPEYIQEYLIAHNLLINTESVSKEYKELYPDTYAWDKAAPIVSICLREDGECQLTTILDIFNYDEGLIQNLTLNDVIELLNSNETDIDFDDILGGISYDSNGDIISAEIMRGEYRLSADGIDIDQNVVDPSRESWEIDVLNQINDANNFANNVIVISYGDVAFSEEFGAAIGGDGILYSGGCFLLIIYAAMALGKRDYVHSMVGLALCAIITVGLAVLASFGWAGYFGVIYTPFSSTLPFLILGLGVDDAFIIAGEFQLQSKINKSKTIQKRIELTLEHAGVSIFITSLTDMIAFGVGASTQLPALQSFCLYATVGVFFVFALNVTFFAACVVLDAQRAQSNRMDCCCCVKFERKHHMFPDEDNVHNYCFCCHKIPQEISRKFFRWFGDKLSNLYVQIIVILIAVGMLSFSIYGATQLEQDFKLEWFIPDTSYLQEYYEYRDEYFRQGTPVWIYSKDINYLENKDNLLQANRILSNAEYLEGTVFDWHEPFIQWTIDNNITLTNNNYYTELELFLNTQTFPFGGGSLYSGLIAWFDDEDVTKGIQGAQMLGVYKDEFVTNAQEQVKAMNFIRDDCKKYFDLQNIFPFTFAFLFWEQYSVIGSELWRNLIIAMIVIFIIALILIPKISAALLVLVCVVMALTDVLGFMWLWGLNIDAVTVCYTIIAIGLAVDYSAHVGEAFMLSNAGTRKERVIDSLGRMGASVFNGAFSTFLAVLALSFSKTYIFRVFFQQFFLVTILGAAHGLIVLPTLLAIMGPSSIKENDNDNDDKHLKDDSKPQEIMAKQIQMGNTNDNEQETGRTENEDLL